MSKEQPTPEEQAYIDSVLDYEDKCMAWSPGDPWPAPIKRKRLTWRPSFPSDDPAVWQLMMGNYASCARAYKSGPFPHRPRRQQGKAPSNRPAGRPRIFETGRRAFVQLSMDIDRLAEVDRRAQEMKVSRSAFLRQLLDEALFKETP